VRDEKCQERRTYTFSAIIVQTVVSYHLYQNDQFCGFPGSSGTSHLTRFGSALGLGRKGCAWAAVSSGVVSLSLADRC